MELFRQYLQDELVERCRKNPSYSLRAFSRVLGVSHSALSEILNRKRPLTSAMVERLGGRLSLDPEKIKSFKEESPSERGGSHSEQVYQQLTHDYFRMISDWYHYAILELMSVKGFQSDIKWISRALSLSVNETRAALERLERLEMIEKDKNGNYKNSSGFNTTVGSAVTSSALRKLQKGILEKALTALEEEPIERRDQTSITVAMDVADIPEVKERIKKFRRELAGFLERKGVLPNEVYHLGVSFYPVTSLTKRSES